MSRTPPRAKAAAPQGEASTTSAAAPPEGDVPAGEAPASPTPPPESPTVDPRVAELEAALASSHESYEQQAAELRAEIRSLRGQLEAQRADFRAAWDERERRFAAELSAAHGAPRPRRAVADSRLRVGGAKLAPGDPIPEGTDLAKLPAGTWRYEEV